MFLSRGVSPTQRRELLGLSFWRASNLIARNQPCDAEEKLKSNLELHLFDALCNKLAQQESMRFRLIKHFPRHCWSTIHRLALEQLPNQGVNPQRKGFGLIRAETKSLGSWSLDLC